MWSCSAAELDSFFLGRKGVSGDPLACGRAAAAEAQKCGSFTAGQCVMCIPDCVNVSLLGFVLVL